MSIFGEIERWYNDQVEKIKEYVTKTEGNIKTDIEKHSKDINDHSDKNKREIKTILEETLKTQIDGIGTTVNDIKIATKEIKDNLIESNRKFVKENVRLSDQVKSLDKEITGNKSKITLLNNSINDKEKIIAEKSEKIGKMQNTLDNKNGEITKLNKEISSLEEKKKEIERQADNLQSLFIEPYKNLLSLICRLDVLEKYCSTMGIDCEHIEKPENYKKIISELGGKNIFIDHIHKSIEDAKKENWKRDKNEENCRISDDEEKLYKEINKLLSDEKYQFILNDINTGGEFESEKIRAINDSKNKEVPFGLYKFVCVPATSTNKKMIVLGDDEE